MRKNVFKLALALGAAMLFGFAGCTVEVNEPEPITPTSYAVGISEGIENGTVTADKQTAQKDEAVTLTLSASTRFRVSVLVSSPRPTIHKSSTRYLT